MSASIILDDDNVRTSVFHNIDHCDKNYYNNCTDDRFTNEYDNVASLASGSFPCHTNREVEHLFDFDSVLGSHIDTIDNTNANYVMKII